MSKREAHKSDVVLTGAAGVALTASTRNHMLSMRLRLSAEGTPDFCVCRRGLGCICASAQS